MLSPALSFGTANTDDNSGEFWGDGCNSDRPFLLGVTGVLHRLIFKWFVIFDFRFGILDFQLET